MYTVNSVIIIVVFIIQLRVIAFYMFIRANSRFTVVFLVTYASHYVITISVVSTEKRMCT